VAAAAAAVAAVAVVAAVAAAVEAVPGEAVSAVVGWASHARVVPGAVDVLVSLAARAPVLGSDAADAEVSSLEAASAVLAAVAVVAAEVDPAGSGPQLGAGSIVAGVALHLRRLLSRRNNPHRQRMLRKQMPGM
jgi:hypothetical protein